MEKISKNRIHFLDELRGFAIICMVVHHALFDIGYLLELPFGYHAFEFFAPVQPIFWVIFIVTSGLCSNLSRSSTKRGVLVLAISLGMTFVTAVIMPLCGFGGEQIYFGVLHCLACCMIFVGLTSKWLNKIPVTVGLALSMALFVLTYSLQTGRFGIGVFSVALPASLTNLAFLFPFGIVSPTFSSADYFPLFPWMFLFLFGVFLGRMVIKNGFPSFTYKSRSKFLQFMGKNSLWVYVAHQVVLYGIFLVIKAIFF